LHANRSTEPFETLRLCDFATPRRHFPLIPAFSRSLRSLTIVEMMR
jgi:hypothetical protein